MDDYSERDLTKRLAVIVDESNFFLIFVQRALHELCDGGQAVR